MQDCIRVSSIESILQYCFRLNYVTNLLHDIHKMKVQNDNVEITIFQSKVMQGKEGVVAFTEFNDTVFKGLSTLTGLISLI